MSLREKIRDGRHPLWMEQVALALSAVLLIKFPAAIAILALFGVWRSVMASALAKTLEERTFWLFILSIGPLIVFLIAHPAPTDDLLRNLRVWMHGGDYRPMYWGSPGVGAGDEYLGFDWAVGHIDRIMQGWGLANWTWLPVVALSVSLWGGLLVAVFLRAHPVRTPEQLALFIAIVLSLWLNPNFLLRVTLGRPEAFFALWALSAVLVRGQAGLALWFASGLALSTGYWFFWIYAPSALLLWPHLPWTWANFRRRFLIGLIWGLSGMVFWVVVSHGHILDWFWHLHVAIGQRVAPVGENSGLSLGLIFSPFMTGIGIAVWLASGMSASKENERQAVQETPEQQAGSRPALSRPQKGLLISLGLLCAWFALPNMVRYIDSVSSLGMLAVWVVGANLLAHVKTSPRIRSIAGALCVLILIGGGIKLGTGSKPLLDLTLPGARPGDKVLTFFSQDTYDTLYLNPQVRVAPAFELGFTRKDVQQASVDLMKGHVSCAWLRTNKVDWVIAPQGAPIEAQQWERCLSLVRVASGASVWKLRPEQ